MNQLQTSVAPLLRISFNTVPSRLSEKGKKSHRQNAQTCKGRFIAKRCQYDLHHTVFVAVSFTDPCIFSVQIFSTVREPERNDKVFN